MIFLNQADVSRTVDLNDMMDQIEKAYKIYGQGDFYMPERPTVEYRDKTLIYMPCFLNDSFGTKILTQFPENGDKGLPIINGLMLLNDYETGAPAALLDGQSVTAYRTGAVGGVGIRHLSRRDCHSVGIVGAGTQGFYQALYACAAREIHTVNILNRRGRDMTAYIERLIKAIDNPQTKVVQYSKIEELVGNSEIICTTTPSETPVLPDDAALLEGKCIIAIGSYKPSMREIPDAVWQLVDNVYVELPYACEESGDLSQPLAAGLLTMDRVRYMDEYLAAGAVEEVSAGKTTFFKSVGMGLFDVCIANGMIAAARQQGIGQEIKL